LAVVDFTPAIQLTWRYIAFAPGATELQWSGGRP